MLQNSFHQVQIPNPMCTETSPNHYLLIVLDGSSGSHRHMSLFFCPPDSCFAVVSEDERRLVCPKHSPPFFHCPILMLLAPFNPSFSIFLADKWRLCCPVGCKFAGLLQSSTNGLQGDMVALQFFSKLFRCCSPIVFHAFYHSTIFVD